MLLCIPEAAEVFSSLSFLVFALFKNFLTPLVVNNGICLVEKEYKPVIVDLGQKRCKFLFKPVLPYW